MSRNIEDRRGTRGGGIGMMGPGMGIGGVVLLVLGLLFGQDLMQGGDAPGETVTSDGTAGAPVSSEALDRSPEERRVRPRPASGPGRIAG